MTFLTPLRRGLLYFLLHVVTQVAMLALSKDLMTHYDFGEVLFLRLLPAWAGVAFFVFFRSKNNPWKSKKRKEHIWRGFVGFINMLLLYMSVKLLPFALAMTIRQLEAFIWVLIAAFFYQEKVSRRQWLALAIGFTGVMLVLRPSVEANLVGAIVAVLCAVVGGYTRVLSRELSRTEKSSTIIFFNFSQWTLLSMFVTPWNWNMPENHDWFPLLFSGAIILISQWFMTEGMALAPAPRVAPLRHTEILWSGLIGWLVWSEPISAWFVAGGTLIVIGGVMANWRQKKPALSDPIEE